MIGETINSALHKTSAKMVELDVEAQFIPALYGLKIGLGAYAKTPAFVAAFRPAAFKNLWGSLQNPRSDSVITASYQSVLENVTWGDLGDSKFLKELKERSENLLSIKFNVHTYQPDDASPFHTFGRIEGTIGPANDAEPTNFVRGRLFRSVESTSKWSTSLTTNIAAFVVDSSRRTLTIDLGNALKRNDTNGYANFNLAVLGDRLCIRTDADESSIDVAKIDLTRPEDILRTAGVLEIPLGSASVLEAVNANFLKVDRCDTDVNLMYEMTSVVRPMGKFSRRVNAGEKFEIEFFAARRGQPLCNYPIPISIRIKSIQTDKSATPAQVAKAKRALTVNGQSEAEVYTKCNGRARVTFDTADPGHPRDFLDGEIYKVKYCHTNNEEPTGVASNLWIVVYENFTYDRPPTWFGGVKDLLQPYANMYPTMDAILVLSDYNVLTQPRNLVRLRRVLSVDEYDPSYMPTTRDLSSGKRQMLLEWIDNPLRGRREKLDHEGVCRALQTAIQVEHATIPMYLYALFSIKPGANLQVASVLRTIVVQEMLHVTLVANVLNAIEGCPPPNLLQDDFIPVYPNHLPGGLRPELVVRLSRVSRGLIKDVFMNLEIPVRPLGDDDDDNDDDDERNHNTIGAFYRRLKRSIIRLEKKGKISFRDDTSRQVYYEYPGIGKVFVITNLSTVIQALDEIQEQGEGSRDMSPVDSTGQLSHYYRFAEIIEGRRLVQSDNGTWSYTGDTVPFDVAGVWPLLDNPRVRDYPEGSRAHLLANGFSRTYLDLIAQLQHAFNGNPSEVEESFSTMLALRMKAGELVQIPADDFGIYHVGPPFVNPRDLFNTYS